MVRRPGSLTRLILPAYLEFQFTGKAGLFRTLHSSDVTPEYVDALRSQHEYIDHTSPTIDIGWQRNYVAGISASAHDAICGLFMDGQLVGTAGLQNLNEGGSTTMGIFVIGARNRGQGHGKALVWAATILSRDGAGIRRIEAGMWKSNARSLRSFEACNYTVIGETADLYRVAVDTTAVAAPPGVSDYRVISEAVKSIQ